MLRKMYLIPADRLRGSPFMTREPSSVSIRKQKALGKKRKHHAEAVKIRKHHPYKQWLKVRRKMDDADLRKKTETNVIADFLSREMATGQASKDSPTPPPPPPTPQKMRRGTQTDVTAALVTASHLPPPMKEFTYESSKEERVDDDDDDDEYDDDDNLVEEQAHEYGRENVVPVASVYLMPYVYKRRSLDTQYGVRKDGDMFMIGDSHIVVDTIGDITIKDRVFKGSKGLCELLTCKKVNTEFITKDDLKSYKKILLMTKAHLTKHQPVGNINISRGKTFRDIITPFFAQPKGSGVESVLRRKRTKY